MYILAAPDPGSDGFYFLAVLLSSPSVSDSAAGNEPGDSAVPEPRDFRGPWLRAELKGIATSPPPGQPGHGDESIVRNQPARIVNGRAEGGYNETYEVICPSCGDSPDLDYAEISLGLQWLRGPHTLEVALAVFHEHQGIPWLLRP
jgi:hypothetical protein